jgi:hypothetical protein
MRYLALALCALALAACSSGGTTATPTSKAATSAPTAPTRAPEQPQPTPGQPISNVPTSAPVQRLPTQPPPAAPVTGRVYACESGDCDCGDFPTHAEAQRVYIKHGGNNWSRLDADLDGSACETLP